ncbi:LytR/AlgR family response regulator transcription factor [Algimonas porphyrae]|uniref:HTH LytTR-type domain-containing protein n=1 Tax=Algimonas porphyrae TaxID=1128113 RepID=A0ABQ5V3V3_9PROT|nr:LytTR family DNA-binding domain-containing protein [Algimonas porphyrae]GLQ21732.1 hypothetical protein GCM10007854_26870 [Algimonas porphyrae]
MASSTQARSKSPNLKVWLIAIGWIGLSAIYVTIFMMTQMSGFADAVRRALISVIPAALLAIPSSLIVSRLIIDRPLWLQAAAHITLSGLFALFWYLGIQTGYGLQEGWLLNGLSTNRFYIGALVWQLFQGVLLYALIAAITYAVHFHDMAKRVRLELDSDRSAISPGNAESTSLRRLLVRNGREIVPVDLSEVILISGASDFVEVITARASYTSSKTLAELAESLPGADFDRIHRSHIVRLDKILSVANSGDGRLTLGLEAGHSVTTSRSGAKRFRQRTA